MATFRHSIVLFSGDDGLPLEFNVRNTKEKDHLKALIEHGGGFCSQSETAVHLITPGTKVLNADLGKKLVSSRYIFDCAERNYLLDVNEYIFTISEAETSDISEEDSIIKENYHESSKELSMDIDISDKDIGNTPDLTVPSNKNNAHDSTTSGSFIEGSKQNSKIVSGLSYGSDRVFESPPFASTAKDILSNQANNTEMDLSPISTSASLVSPVMRRNRLGIVHSQANAPESPSAVHTVVSSSQEAMGDLDQFDNSILNKIQMKPQEDEEDCLSRSYTVSSSVDAEVGSKPNSAEIFEGAPIPDSPGQGSYQTIDSQLYMKNLEAEVEKVLKKPSPKSIQDKIVLVKYVCCVKKLSPAAVLQSLHSLCSI